MKFFCVCPKCSSDKVRLYFAGKGDAGADLSRGHCVTCGHMGPKGDRAGAVDGWNYGEGVKYSREKRRAVALVTANNCPDLLDLFNIALEFCPDSPIKWKRNMIVNYGLDYRLVIAGLKEVAEIHEAAEKVGHLFGL